MKKKLLDPLSIRVGAEIKNGTRGVSIYISANSGALMLTDDCWESRATGEEINDFVITKDSAAELMTQLWDAGIRPARSTGPKKVDAVTDCNIDEIHYLRGLASRMLDKIPHQVDTYEVGELKKTVSVGVSNVEAGQ